MFGLFILLLAACAPLTSPKTIMKASPTAGAMMEGSPTPGAMMESSPTSGAMMETSPTSGTMMETTPTPGAMMESSPTPGVMMETSPTPKAMMETSATPGAMMETSPTPELMTTQASTSGAMMAEAAWYRVDFTDAASGKIFSIDAFKGKVILVETLAIWCPTCLSQEQQVLALQKSLAGRTDFINIGLDIDTNEKLADLKTYVAMNGFNWQYSVASPAVAHEIGNLYGAQFLDPPSTPMLIIDRQGEAHLLPFGVKSTQTLLNDLSPYLAQ
jgi:thiol-disulfide isomerase/thioredoxin